MDLEYGVIIICGPEPPGHQCEPRNLLRQPTEPETVRLVISQSHKWGIGTDDIGFSSPSPHDRNVDFECFPLVTSLCVFLHKNTFFSLNLPNKYGSFSNAPRRRRPRTIGSSLSAVDISIADATRAISANAGSRNDSKPGRCIGASRVLYFVVYVIIILQGCESRITSVQKITHVFSLMLHVVGT